MAGIPGCYQFCSEVSIIINGTPTRGHVIVPVANAGRAFDYVTHRSLGDHKTELLLWFIRLMCGAQQPPVGWTWTSQVPEKGKLTA
jgi:hypothetical protein